MRKLESGRVVNQESFLDIVRYENESLHNMTITNSNIGAPIFFGCTLREITFDTCDLSNARLFAHCMMDTCTFIRCDLRAVGIGQEEAVFVNCEFTSCDMRGMTMENATFVNCTFTKCKLQDRVLQASRIVNCTFAGKLVDITFEGNGKQGLQANFANCMLDGVVFQGCDLSLAVPPKLKNHIYVDDLSLRVKKALIRIQQNEDPSSDDGKILLRYVKKLYNNPQYIFNTSYMRKVYGDAFAEKFVQYLELHDLV